MEDKKNETNEENNTAATAGKSTMWSTVAKFILYVTIGIPLVFFEYTVDLGYYVQYTEVEILEVDDKPSSFWSAYIIPSDFYPAKVKVVKHPTGKDIDLLLLTKDQLKYAKKGGRMMVTVEPHNPSSWLDFQQCIYNSYDFCVTEVFGIKDEKGKYKKI
jgi:hypothetical protein